MKQGIIILKPDFFDSFQNYELFCNLLSKHNLEFENSYKVANYSSFCSDYRIYDIKNTFIESSQDYFNEIRKTSYATEAYKLKYAGESDFGVAVVFQTELSNSINLYEHLASIKNEFRKIKKLQNPHEYYLVVSVEPHYLIYALPQYIESIEKEQNIDTKLVCINGIHVEEEKLYNDGVCQSFLEQSNIILPNNLIDIGNESIYRTQKYNSLMEIWMKFHNRY